MPVLYSHSAVTVTDLRASLSYYRDALGLEIANEKCTADRLSVDLRLPGTDRVWVLEEYPRQTRYPASSRPCDPGFAHLCLYVGDAEAVFARLQALGFTSRAPVATVASGALAGAKAVYTMDPDGFVVELYQRAGETGPPAVTGFFHHGLTVTDIEATLAFWQNQMGVELLRRSSAPGAMAGAIAGLEFERVEAAFVGLADAVAIEIFEYRGIERHSALARAADPASSRLALRVADPDGLCERLGGYRDASGVPRVTDPTGYPILLLPL
ncbi:VOC family protein [Nocardia rhamnosiphila]|uniref:VOC family protein n=1 Tax=Nocardia rhamnosiphila TaxID=426716 RepID=A0ABV2X0M6_9NOCA